MSYVYEKSYSKFDVRYREFQKNHYFWLKFF
jgi:hypothetical protein